MKTETKDSVKEKLAIELLETAVDERGLPVFGVIEIEDAKGNKVKAYKHEKCFEPEDYQKAALYQRKLADHHRELADYYSAEYEKRKQEKGLAQSSAF